MKENIFESGKFFVGCNYWASHAGTDMWRNWDEKQVDEDLAKLEKGGLTVLRVFPLWPDFQPIKQMYGLCGGKREMRMGEDPLPFTEEGRCGVDKVVADRFETFCDLAHKHGMKLIVGLVTGWMSGRLFMPEGLAGLDPLVNPTAIKWEIKFVRYMVRRFKNHPALGAWDLGNECNCMGNVDTESAFVWASVITNTVRSEDREHPVVSGMHGLRPEGHAWSPADQGEILDILCTHPYPQFTAYVNLDPMGSMRSVLHATAESIFFGTLGNKPCFVEEAGNLGPMIASDEMTGEYIRASVFSAWAHDLRGYTWWCAHDQTELEQAPYDWHPMERELGLIRINGEAKPGLEELRRFGAFLKNDFPYEMLPARLKDAVCILSRAQDTWGTAYGAFMLAKQAGLDIDFAWCNDEIPESKVYLLASLCGGACIMKHFEDEILRRVADGATLCVSTSDATIDSFEARVGLRVVKRHRAVSPTSFVIDGETVTVQKPYTMVYENAGAKELLADEKGVPVVTEKAYGKGKILFVAFPIELIAGTHGAVVKNGEEVPYLEAVPLYKIYSLLGIRNADKIASCDESTVGLTEHPVSASERIVNVLNQTPTARRFKVTLDGGWKLDRSISVAKESVVTAVDGGVEVELPGDTGVVVILKK